MRPINSTTLAISESLLLAAFTACIALRNTWGPPVSWLIAAAILFAFAVGLLVFGWVIPRALGNRESESSDEGSGVPTNRFGNIRAWATFWRRSSGGIELNAGISTGGDESDEEGPNENEDSNAT